MFRDQYKADNEKINPDEALMKYLSVRLTEETEKTEAEQNRMIPLPVRRRWMRPVVALASCAAIALCAGGLYLFRDILKKQPALTPQNVKEVKTGVSYEELYGLIKAMENKYGEMGVGTRNGQPEFANQDALTAGQGTDNKSAAEAASASNDYSKTNTQVSGVDEADIVKTDGKYIYTLANNKLNIVEVQGATMKKLSSMDCTVYAGEANKSYPAEMYVRGNFLVVLKNVYDNGTKSAAGAQEQYEAFDMAWRGGNTSAAVYDIADRTKPKLLADSGQSGSYLSSRMIGQTLYLITNHTIYGAAVKGTPESYIPMLYNNGKGSVMAPADITVSVEPQLRQYIVVSAINITDPEVRLSSKSIFGCGSNLYASADNLLIASHSQSKSQVDADNGGMIEPDFDANAKKQENSGFAGAPAADTGAEAAFAGAGVDPVAPDSMPANSGKAEPAQNSGGSAAGSSEKTTSVAYNSTTNLIRFSLNNGKIHLEATGSIPGNLLNQFSMDEYKNVFRIVTTTNNYVESQAGSENNATVSYTPEVNTNALYTLNEKLQIIGRIEDVSKGERVYSVRFDGDIGYFVTFRQVDPLFAVDLKDPAKPKILSVLNIPGLSDYLHPYSDGLLFGLGRDADENGKVNGLKLSMFDVSNPADITEKHKLALSEYYSEASYNHKAIIVSPDRGLIAFPGSSKYLVFSYASKDGFVKAGEFATGIDDYNQRGLYIENTFYVCSNSSITAYSMNGFAKLAELKY